MLSRCSRRTCSLWRNLWLALLCLAHPMYACQFFIQSLPVTLLCPALLVIWPVHLSSLPQVSSLLQAQDKLVSPDFWRCRETCSVCPQRVDSFRSFQPHRCAKCSIGRTARLGRVAPHRNDHWRASRGPRLRCGVLYHVAKRELTFHGVVGDVRPSLIPETI